MFATNPEDVQAAENEINEYETELHALTPPADIQLKQAREFSGHICPEIESILKCAREMKEIKKQHEELDGTRDNLIVFCTDVDYLVRDRIQEIEAYEDDFGRDGHEFCADLYLQRITEALRCELKTTYIDTLSDDIAMEVTNGEVGKILWYKLKTWIRIKSVSEFLWKVATERRHAPGGFVEIANSAAAYGDDRLELCAKRALQHDVLARIVRARLGAEAYHAIESEVNERVEELLA
jgi:hypothetical protein